MRALFAVVIACVAAGCGGSSSETPWPVEPEGVNLGPAGEAAPSSSVPNQVEAPDAGAAERPPSPPSAPSF